MKKATKWLFLTANGQAVVILITAFLICALLQNY
jgi:hypothetical protein